MKYKFIDLFCGIGGFHIAFHDLGLACVLACDNDEKVKLTYYENFKSISPKLFTSNNFHEDICDIDTDSIPDFDLLCAGFPCQPFSQAGFKKGFKDAGRGELFFEIARIIKEKQPSAIFLENVRHIAKHDEGKTLDVIKRVIEELGYTFDIKIVKASDHGLPQHRARAYMVGFNKSRLRPNAPSFIFPTPCKGLKLNMSDVWEGECSREIGFTLRCGGRKSGINNRWNWDAYLVDGEVRYLSSKEGKRMMGFPDTFSFPVSEHVAMKQLGNSVAINAVQEVGKEIVKYLKLNME